ncbi:MAG: sensor histidine kinase [Candidatus Dormibacteraceae bacterium]
MWALALVMPPAITAGLDRLGAGRQRDYVFIYLGLVAVVGVLRGFWPAISSAALSFLLVDYFFVLPVGTLTMADEQDIVDLLAFVVTASVVGLLASMRRRALLGTEALAARLREANSELIRLNRDQAAAAQAALRLARSEQQVRHLQQTDQLRQELLANVSHELRTPLGTILTESTADGLTTIATAARRLKALVDDMLDMARIEGGALQLRLEPLLLADALEASRDRLRERSSGREVRWQEADAAVEVLSDWDRLGQILNNLFSNADRFSPPGAAIEVEVSLREPGLVEVAVRDHGPGVPAAVRDHVFDRFVQGEVVGTGTGLGLAIVKGLVEAHGCTVSLDQPQPGGGACFRFTLPRAAGQ